MITRIRWLHILVTLICLAVVSIFVYHANKPRETRTVYMLPEYKDTARVEAEVLEPKPPPKPQPSYDTFLADIVKEEIKQVDDDGVSDDEVEDFLDLVKLAMEEPDSKPVDVMRLTPDEMVEYLNENYTHREQHDFLMSDRGEDWIRYAFDAPPIQTPSADECRKRHPDDVSGFNSCMEEQHRLAITPYRKQLATSVERLMNFYSQLDPEVFSYSRNDVGASVLSPPQPPEALIGSEF